MLLDLSEIVIREGMRSSVDVNPVRIEDPDLELVSPLQGTLTFENAGDVLVMHGRVEGTFTAACSRCLADVRLPIAIDVDEHFEIEHILHPQRPLTDLNEETDTTVSTVVYLDQGRPILDLSELLRQIIVAEMPIQVLCDEACSGLCPYCGVNRNETACKCEEAQRNTPLAGLAALLSEEEEGSAS